MRSEDLAQLLANNPGLQELILENCSQISKLPDHPSLHVVSLTSLPLAAVKGNYPALRALHCEGCGRLNEIALPTAPIAQLTAKNCSGLNSLKGNPDTLEDLNIEGSQGRPFVSIRSLHTKI